MDDDFFAVSNPPAEEPPAPLENAILLGAPPPQYLGDVVEADSSAFATPSYDAPSFAAPPDAFVAPPGENDFANVPASDAFSSPPIILSAPALEPETVELDEEPVEPSAMAKWNYEWQETLKSRKDEENAKKAEMIESASLDLERLQKEREIKREARIAKNREDEQAKLEAIEADLENDNSWQRVVKMVELSHDSKEEAEDVKRMRDVMIHLKNDAARATVLGA